MTASIFTGWTAGIPGRVPPSPAGGGHWGVPGPVRSAGRYLAVAHRAVIRLYVERQAAVHQAFRLERVHRPFQLLRLIRADHGGCVEPDGQYVAVLREQLPELRYVEFVDVPLEILLAFIRVIPGIPVISEPVRAAHGFKALRHGVPPFPHVGIIESQFYPFLPAGFTQFHHGVASERRGVHNV